MFLGIAVHIRYISERFEAVLNRSHWPAPVHAIAETSHPPVQHSAALSSTQAGRKQRKTEMLLVGLTGGIATGKSTVTAWFRTKNVAVIDCDQLVHDLQKPGTRCTRALDRAFPGVVKNGALDRAALGAAIFGDVAKRRRLDAVMRPFIARTLIEAIGYHFCVGTSLVILDAPLLFEFKLDKICALSIVVAAAPETQLKRVMARDSIDEGAAKKRIAAQMPLALKLDRCDVALQNDTSKVALHALLDMLLPRLRKRARRRYFVSLPGFVFVVVLIYTFSYLARRDRLLLG